MPPAGCRLRDVLRNPAPALAGGSSCRTALPKAFAHAAIARRVLL